MKHFLYVGGIYPFENPSLGDVLSRRVNIGGNCGNLLFINAVIKSAMVSDDIDFHPTQYRSVFTEREIKFANSYYDAFLLPLADALRPDNIAYLKGLTSFIKKLTIPCYLIGIGLRTGYDTDLSTPFLFDDAASDFMKAVLEKSACVGVRGERTAAYLKRLGFVPEKDFTVIGCPSVSAFVQNRPIATPVINSDSKLDFHRIIMIANTLAPGQVSEMMLKSISDWDHVTVVAQKEMEQENIYLGNLSAVYKGEIGPCENIFGRKLYNRLYRNGRLKTYTNLPSWFSDVKDCDLCLSARFHGSVVTLAQQVPTVLLPFDSRTRELAEYHKIPSLYYEDMTGDNFVAALQTLDFNSHLSVLERNTGHYIDFLNTIGLDNIYRHTYESLTPYDKAVQGVAWEQSARNYSEISLKEKMARVADYYSGKIENRMNPKRNSIIVKE